MATFKQKVKVVFVSYGSRENRRRAAHLDAAKANVEALQQAGIKSVFYGPPIRPTSGSSWRRSLHEFAPLLFRD